jgi:hypothetical protein
MKIVSVSYQGYGGKNSDKHFDVTIVIRDEHNNPVAGASLQALIYSDGGDELPVAGTTDSTGAVVFGVKNARNGNWSATVLQVTANGFEWDGVNLENSFSK